jgi:hypothetical protein
MVFFYAFLLSVSAATFSRSRFAGRHLLGAIIWPGSATLRAETP